MYARVKPDNFYVVVSLLVLAGWLWFLLPSVAGDAHVSVCIFKSATGFPCPACGSTTSLQLIAAGEWNQALQVNPLGYLMGAGLLILPAWLFFDLVSGVGSFRRAVLFVDGQVKKNKVLLLLILLPILLNWIWNIVKAGAA